MDRTFALLGALSGFVSVAAGAFGAHALALLAVAAAVPRWPAAAPAGWLFLAGTAVFSGSLYALALTGVRALGAATPVGGVAFLAGWLWLAVAALRARGS